MKHTPNGTSLSVVAGGTTKNRIVMCLRALFFSLLIIMEKKGGSDPAARGTECGYESVFHLYMDYMSWLVWAQRGVHYAGLHLE